MSWERAYNVLCVRLDSVGDVLMTTPALRALKQALPGRRITVLASPTGAAAARLVPELDAVLEFKAPWMKMAPGTPAGDRALVAALQSARFDAAVIFTVYSQSPLPAAYVCYLAGVPLVLAHCHENPYQLITDWILDPEPHTTVRHEVRRQLDLVASIGCRPTHERLSLTVPISARRRATAMLAAAGVDAARPLVVAHPGATAVSRRYPPELFSEALELLARPHGCQIVVTGSAAEADLVGRVRAAVRSPSISLAGRLDLTGLCAVISAADVVVSNNTAPVHIAAAVGTPVVDLYALTNPQHTPWLVPHRLLYHDVPCRYCYKSVCPAVHNDCLRRVEPEAVAAAALDSTPSCRRGRARPRRATWARAARRRPCSRSPTTTRCPPAVGSPGLEALDSGADAAAGRIVMPLPRRPTDYERDAARLATAEFVTANCFCRARTFARLGGFDERFALAWREDSDLHFRLLDAGAAIVRAPAAVVVHPVRPARFGVSVSQQRKIAFDALLYKKHRALYRARIRRAPRWDYYTIVAALLGALATGAPRLALAFAAAPLACLGRGGSDRRATAPGAAEPGA